MNKNNLAAAGCFAGAFALGYTYTPKFPNPMGGVFDPFGDSKDIINGTIKTIRDAIINDKAVSDWLDASEKWEDEQRGKLLLDRFELTTFINFSGGLIHWIYDTGHHDPATEYGIKTYSDWKRQFAKEDFDYYFERQVSLILRDRIKRLVESDTSLTPEEKMLLNIPWGSWEWMKPTDKPSWKYSVGTTEVKPPDIFAHYLTFGLADIPSKLVGAINSATWELYWASLNEYHAIIKFVEQMVIKFKLLGGKTP